MSKVAQEDFARVAEIPVEYADECMKWAFGDTFSKLDDVESIKSHWNSRHKQILELRGNEEAKIAIKKIASIYKRLFMPLVHTATIEPMTEED